jgi:sortase A
MWVTVGPVTEFWSKRYLLAIFILYAIQVRWLMWTARGDVMRSRNLVLMAVVLAMVVALAGCSSAGQSAGDQGQVSQKKASQKQPEKETAGKQEPDKKMTDEAKSKQVAPKKGTEQDAGSGKNLVEPPEKKRLRLTVPAMKKINNDPIPTGLGTDEQLFHDYAGVHLNSTGFPWKKTTNVYIAGHRIGFPGTRSNLAFYDLEDLKNGDKVYLEDADGRKYTYVVYKKLIVGPTDLKVLNPVEGKNIISLQTCTLPDYTRRVIYRAELKDIESQDTKSGDEKSQNSQS